MVRALAVALLSLGACAAVYAQQSEQCFPDDQGLETRYRNLIHTIRCMQCRGQSVAESPAEQADNIKRQTCDRMREGLSDNEIRQYFADRYGDSINFRPPLKPSTWLLWGGPIVLLAVGGVAFVRILRKRMAQPLDEDLE